MELLNLVSASRIGAIAITALATLTADAGRSHIPPEAEAPTDTISPSRRIGPGHLSNQSTEEAWLEEDFSGYATTAELLEYPNSIWSGPNEDVATGSISLDQVAPPVGGRSMRYTFRNRTGRRNLCHDYTIGRNIQFPSPVREVWVEVWFKFSVGWETYVPECRGQSSNGYKFLFGRVRRGGRFAVIVGVHRSHNYSLEYPGGGTAFHGRGPRPVAWERITDGNWHQLQQHLRISSRDGAADGVMETRIDGVVLRSFRNVPVKASEIYGLALGRNLNQGPTREQSLWWGRIRAWNSDPGWGF